MDQGEGVHVEELAGLLGYRSRSNINYLVKTGRLAEPQRVLTTSRQWRHFWPRSYVDGLSADPWFAKRIARAKR